MIVPKVSLIILKKFAEWGIIKDPFPLNDESKKEEDKIYLDKGPYGPYI